MKIPVELDRSSKTPLAAQLAVQLASLIRQRRIPSGTRLPSSRTLSEQLGVARNTVVHAYETLTIEGLLEARAASGFFATPDVSPDAPPSVVTDAPSTQTAAPGKPLPGPVVVRARARVGATRQHRFYDFLPGRPSADLFPVKIWRRLLQSRLSYGGAAGMSEPSDAAGLAVLRGAIAEHLSLSRGIVADPRQILVVGGVQEGLSLTARLLGGPGVTVATETPCYRDMTYAFEATGARLIPVPVDEDGLVAAQLPETGADLLYLTPAHQYPTGYTLSSERRGQVIGWARRHGCYLLEDDYDSAYQYDGSPMQALAGVAPDRTIHLGTFSTTLGAGLRLGYMVVPPSLADAARAMKTMTDAGSSWLDQATLAEFLRAGCYRTHLTRTRAVYKERRDALLASLRRYFGSVQISGEAAGLHVFWRLPAGVPEAARLEELALGQRVRVYSMTSAAAHDLTAGSMGRRSVLIGFAGLTPNQIDQGVARLSDAVDDTLDRDHDFLRELMLDEPPPSRPRPGRPAGRGSRFQLQRRSAARAVAPARARLQDQVGQPETLGPIVRGIYRYPIKGLSPQPLPGVVMEEGKPFPFDRVFALARPGVPIDTEQPRWAKKGLFLMLMLDETLARVRTHVDVDTLQLTIYRPPEADGAGPGESPAPFRADLGKDEGRRAVEDYFFRQVPGLPAAPRLVRSMDGHFMDKPDNVVSCMNLATLRSLEEQWGVKLDPLRFRANFYIDGAPPWSEFDWIGRDILLGDVLFRVDRRNGRCGATNVDPATGARDMDIPGKLRTSFGHKDLGIYLVARSGGKVVVGDRVGLPESKIAAQAAPAPAVMAARGPSAFICRGCYYIYDESKAGIAFGSLADDWRCPDCGTGKGTFRPYSPPD
ncbi:MAG TPA: aminotransferase class I/II-fold pyridoxal phosphate-dependent enzyme [Polyangia bacterium]|nr:aminotransferase class I/II-fold pyridoxal phosphate-dependent enzyme [Polyangia bacterium]